MANSFKQASFASGVISPQLLGRSDLQKYASGLRTCTNAQVTRYGTIENSPGTQFCGYTEDSSDEARLIPFISFTGSSYVLEFPSGSSGGGKFIPWKNGARIPHVAVPAWVSGAYSAGSYVTYGGLTWYALVDNTGSTPGVGPFYWRATSPDYVEVHFDVPSWSSTIRYNAGALVLYSGNVYMCNLKVLGGSNPSLNNTNWALQGTSSAFPYVVPPSAVMGMTYVQQNDIITLASQQMIPQKILHYSDTRWVVVNATIDDTDILSATVSGGTGGGPSYAYVITYTDPSTGIESPPPLTYAIGSAPSNSAPNVIHLSGGGSGYYNVYSDGGAGSGLYGYIGRGKSTFNDNNIIPDTSKQPPATLSGIIIGQTVNPFTEGTLPAIVACYQQRLCFANTLSEPSTIWMTNVGEFNCLLAGSQAADSDAIQATLSASVTQPITAMVDLGKLIIHTSAAEYAVSGNSAGALTPSALTITNTGSAGSAIVQPVVIGNTDLFVQEGATRLNDLRYEVQRFTFTGKDLTKYATDLFKAKTIVCMAYQKLPHSIVWCVLDDGTLLGLTYVSEDELFSWHVRLTDSGLFEQVACVNEDSAWVLYAIVNRTVNGVQYRSMERFSSRSCLDIVLYSDSVFLDASLTYDGHVTDGTTVSLTTAGGWTQTDLITVTASAAKFSSGTVGDTIVIQKLRSNGLVADQVVLSVVAYTSATVVKAVPKRTVPTWAQAAGQTVWGIGAKTFSGIGHLNGAAIGVLADGSVVANPLDPSIPDTVTVSGGSFTLQNPALVVTAGLPLQMDLETLPMENAQGPTIANRNITVRTCSPVFYASRGGYFGQDEAHLDKWIQPSGQDGYPPPPYTGIANISINGATQPTGQVHIRQIDPLPFSISALVITGEVSGAQQ